MDIIVCCLFKNTPGKKKKTDETFVITLIITEAELGFMGIHSTGFSFLGICEICQNMAFKRVMEENKERPSVQGCLVGELLL